MARVKIEGELIRCDLRHEVDNYAMDREREHYNIFLDCELRTKEGDTVYFKTVPCKQSVNTKGGFGVVCYWPEDSFKGWEPKEDQYGWPKNHPWFAKEGTNGVASVGRPSDTNLVPKVHVGDWVTISASVTEKVSKKGKPYKIATRVKRDLASKETPCIKE